MRLKIHIQRTPLNGAEYIEGNIVTVKNVKKRPVNYDKPNYTLFLKGHDEVLNKSQMAA